jgi:tripartite-type tricarboxylate transporter receptor subunit TctC
VFSSIVYGLQHDALKDLVPVGLLTTTPTWIIATNTLPAKDLKELVAWLKAHPDEASAGIVGHGSPAHLCGVHFQNNTGTRFKFVPYRGGAPLMQDLIAGHIQLACVEASNTRELVESGNGCQGLGQQAKVEWLEVSGTCRQRR